MPEQEDGSVREASPGRALWLLAFATVFLFALYLRLDGAAARGLEYDEIWTLTHYVGKGLPVIFTDLGTPNNHPLHSLAVKISTEISGLNFFTLRLPALLSGLCVLPLAGLFAWRLLKSRMGALLSMAVCAFNGGLVHFSQTARGYSMQTLFVLLAAFSLFAMRESSNKWERKLAPAVFLLAALAAVLTVPSGIVFIAPLCLLWLLFNAEWRNVRPWLVKEWTFILSFCVFGLACLLWYGLNYAKFRMAQGFGVDISSPLLFLSFAWDRLNELAPLLWPLGFLPLCFKRTRRIGFLCAGVIVLALLSALAVKAGPARVYLPLVPFVALGMAASFSAVACHIEKWSVKLSFVLGWLLVLALAANALPAREKWTPTDWIAALPVLTKAFPEEVLIVYPCVDGYPICFNCGEIAVPDYYRRISKFGGILAQVDAPGRISAFDAANASQRDVPMPKGCPFEKARIAGLDIELYRFKPLKHDDSIGNRTVLALFDSGSRELARNAFSSGRWGLLNAWFSNVRIKKFSSSPLVDAFICSNGSVPASELLGLSAKSDGTLRFFILEEQK